MKKEGFTLIELLAVIAIIGILAVILVPNIINMYSNAKQDIFLDEVKTVYKEINSLYLSEGIKNNVVTSVSSDENAPYKLSLSNPNIQYSATIDGNTGNINTLYVKNGNFCVNFDSHIDASKIERKDIHQSGDSECNK